MTTTNDQSSRELELRGLLREWQQAYNRMDDVGVSVADFQSLRRRTHEALSSPTAITAEEAGREGEAALTDRQISAGGRELCNRAAEACEVDREDYWKTYGNEYIEDFRAAYLAAMKPPSAPAQSGGQGNG